MPGSWLAPLGPGVLPFYQKLEAGLRAAGHSISYEVLNRDTLQDRVGRDDAFHLVNHGRMRHPRVRNAGIAYVYPFWNVDPKGIRAFSSIGDHAFDASDIDPELARPFMRRLRRRLVQARVSRYEQPSQAHTVPEGVLAVFLQAEAERNQDETLYLDRWSMLESCLQANSGPVWVKPHPMDTDPKTAAGLAEMERAYPQLSVFSGNIHDLIAASARVVTINSAVGIEAYLHRKPVVLCGQSDFHHIADVARRRADLRDILSRPPRKRPYDKFVWWYFAQNCLSTTDPDLADRVIARFERSM